VDEEAREEPLDLASEQRKVVRNGLKSLLFCIVVLMSSYVVLPRFFGFPDDLTGARSGGLGKLCQANEDVSRRARPERVGGQSSSSFSLHQARTR
jgi:hypothetical protein